MNAMGTLHQIADSSAHSCYSLLGSVVNLKSLFKHFSWFYVVFVYSDIFFNFFFFWEVPPAEYMKTQILVFMDKGSKFYIISLKKGCRR